MNIPLIPSSFKCFEFNLPYQMVTSFYEFSLISWLVFCCVSLFFHHTFKLSSVGSRFHSTLYLDVSSSLFFLLIHFLSLFLFSVMSSPFDSGKDSFSVGQTIYLHAANLCMLISLPLFHFIFLFVAV